MLEMFFIAKNSNTTLVKVKSDAENLEACINIYSNTTLVKVKFLKFPIPITFMLSFKYNTC